MLAATLAAGTLLAATACEQAPAEQPPVRFASSPAIGSWANTPERVPTGGDVAPSSPPPEGSASAGVAAPDPSAAAGASASAAGSGSGAQQTATAGTGNTTAPAAGSQAPPTQNGSAGSAGSAGQNGSAGSAGSAGSPPSSELATSALTFQVLTKSLGGRFSPKNIGAIWIDRADGTFVKTLEVWAATRARYLTRWRAETGSNRVDAVSGATIRTHATHTARWNLTDVARAAVAAGDYKVVIEITDKDATGDSIEIPFTLDQPSSTMPSDQAHFVDMTLTIE